MCVPLDTYVSYPQAKQNSSSCISVMHDDRTPISPKGLTRSCVLWILSAGHSWAGMRRAPDGGFCGGLPFILACKQPEQLCYKWVVYSLLPKSFHGLCYQRLPARLVPLIFVGTADQRKELSPWASARWLSHVLQMGTCQPSSPDVVLTIDFCRSLLQLLATVRPGRSALHFNYSSLWRKISLVRFILLLPRPECTWTPSSLSSQVPCVSKGLSPGCSFRLCL